MKVSDFNNVYKRLQMEDGQKYFDEYLQFMGWFFLNLTLKQHGKICDLLLDWNYPTTERDGETWIICKNGMQLLY